MPERHAAFNREIDATADVLRDLVIEAPPNLASGLNLKSLGEMLKAGALGTASAGCRQSRLRTVYDLFTIRRRLSSTTLVRGRSHQGAAMASLPSSATSRAFAPGSAYVLLHHAFGEVNGKQRAWDHAIGGMGAITQAMAKPPRAAASRSRTARPFAKC